MGLLVGCAITWFMGYLWVASILLFIMLYCVTRLDEGTQ
jgi:hypothetical protein